MADGSNLCRSLEPVVGSAVAAHMTERTPEFYRSQIARIRKLLTGATDRDAVDGLRQLAAEYEARAARAERREKPGRH